MTNEVLPYYNEELSYIRRLGQVFAEKHPKIASKLKLGENASEDPLTERLIESFAFLTSRIRYNLDQDVDQTSSALLNILYPHCTRSIPSLSIMHFEADKDLDALAEIPKGTALKLEDESSPCRFQTCYPVELSPVKITVAELKNIVDAPQHQHLDYAPKSCLKIKLQSSKADLSLAKAAPKKLRFYINADGQYANAIYEQIFNQLEYMAFVANGEQDGADKAWVKFDKSDIVSAVGFSPEDSLFPYPQQSFSGYRLLTEYFVFPEKFLFFDVELPDGIFLENATDNLEILFYFSKLDQSLEKYIKLNSFLLGCAPIVNLFKLQTETIDLDHTQSEYHLVPDQNMGIDNIEVYSVDKFSSFNHGNEQLTLRPFYGLRLDDEKDQSLVYWLLKQKPSWQLGHSDLQGHEYLVSFHQPETLSSGQQFLSQSWKVSSLCYCFNRDLPEKLPFGGGQPALTFEGSGFAKVKNLKCLRQMTAVARPALGPEAQRQLIAHMSLNRYSLLDGTALAPLKTLLSIYNLRHAEGIEKMINSFQGISATLGTVRHPGDPRLGFCQGLDVRLRTTESDIVGTGVYLFGAVLEKFLALYGSINSYTRLIIESETGEELAKWQPQLAHH